MHQGQNDIKDKIVVLLAWLAALTLAYSVYLKLKLLFH